MTAALLLGAVALVARVDGAGAQAADGAEAEFAARVTAERQAHGGSALATEDDLAAVARNHSADMAASTRLYHNPLLGQEVHEWQLLAENIGMGTTVDEIDQLLMASPQHRADILDARFTGIGVGVVKSGDSLWVTEVFRRRSAAAAAAGTPPAPAPAPVSEPAVPARAPRPVPLRRPASTVPPPAPQPVTTVAATVMTPPTTTTSSTTATTGDPVPVAAGEHVPLDLGGLATSSVPVPSRPDLVAAGSLAVALLWIVSASTVRLALRTRLDAGASASSRA